MNLYVIIFSFFLFFFCEKVFAIHSFGVIADIEFQTRNSEKDSPQNANLNFFTFEQNWSGHQSKFIGQLRVFEYFKKQESGHSESLRHEIYPAEFNFAVNQGQHLFVLGYQNVFLTEGFNLIDMEIFHSRNSNISIFSSPEKLYYTSPGISYKLIGETLSMQLFISRFDRTDKINDAQMQILKSSFGEASSFPAFEFNKNNENDILIKMMGTSKSFDWSLYGARTLEKRLNFMWNPSTLEFSQVSLPFNSFGGGISVPVEKYIFRFDFQENLNRNYVGQNNSTRPLNQVNYSLSLDRAVGKDANLVFVLGRSEVKSDFLLSNRESNILDLFVNLNYELNEKVSVDTSYFERVDSQTYGLGLALNTKVLLNIELRYGFESFWAGPKSRLVWLDHEDKVYIGVKATTF